MNDLVGAIFPRFDAPSSLTEEDTKSTVEVTESSENAILADATMSHLDIAAEIEAEENLDGLSLPSLTSEQQAEIERFLSSLDDILSDIELSINARIASAVRCLAEELFPKLSEKFLSEELAYHLPHLLPKSEPKITIRTNFMLAEALRSGHEDSENIPSNCTFIVDDEAKGDCVEIGWGAGGLIFDFDTLLARLLAKIENNSR